MILIKEGTFNINFSLLSFSVQQPQRHIALIETNNIQRNFKQPVEYICSQVSENRIISHQIMLQ